MYRKFFGFKERPFKLVPNPDYLYLGKSHEEALAHLVYAAADGDGFVEITGEVGTGKTTLCRSFLETLDENIEVAYIFNPKLDSIQLLKAINDEFGIDSEPDNIKSLIDTLNTFLMQKKADGQNVIVLVDEAHNLDKEVLEQLRLLSNLETTNSKLLQIILVGQPELSEILDTYELRQLSQRITLSCYLAPLSFQEMKDYIQHRINIAAQRPLKLFSNSALKRIYRFSKGVPRLTNIACDRALLTAFGKGKKVINGPLTDVALRELGGSRGLVRDGNSFIVPAIFTMLALCTVLAVFLFLIPGIVEIDISFNKTGTTQEATKEMPPSVPEATDTNQIKKQPNSQTKNQAAVQNTNKTSEDTFQNNKIKEEKKALPAITTPAKTNSDKQAPEVITAAKAIDKDRNTSSAEPVAAETDVQEPEIVANSNAISSDTASTDKTISAPAPVTTTNSQKPEIASNTSDDIKPPTSTVGASKFRVVADSDFDKIASELNFSDSRRLSFDALAELWAPDYTPQVIMDAIDSDYDFFRMSAKRNSYYTYYVETGLGLIKKLNLPAALKIVTLPDEQPRYIALCGVKDDYFLVCSGASQEKFWVKQDVISTRWVNRAFILWKNFYDIRGTVPRNASPDSILSLNMLLAEIGYLGLDVNTKYGRKSRSAVTKIQKKYGIPIDGVVGAMTKMVLYNENKILRIPLMDTIVNLDQNNNEAKN